MDKARGLPSKTKAGHLCVPKLKRSSTKTKAPSPALTLLERLREAVFRLIMLCALSKTADHSGTVCRPDARRCPYSADHHHSEAVADCIEFIKKKAGSDDENRGSSASSSSGSVGAEPAVIPVPVL